MILSNEFKRGFEVLGVTTGEAEADALPWIGAVKKM